MNDGEVDSNSLLALKAWALSSLKATNTPGGLDYLESKAEALARYLADEEGVGTVDIAVKVIDDELLKAAGLRKAGERQTILKACDDAVAAAGGGLAGAQGGGPLGLPLFKDCSSEIVQQIGVPFDKDVLTDITKLTSALRSELLVKIPICSPQTQVVGTCLGDSTIFLNNTDGRNTTVIGNRISALESLVPQSHVSISEEMVLACCTTITGRFWKELGKYLDSESRLLLEVNYNKKDPSGYTVGSDRPDETVYINDFLVAKGEHKVKNMEEAISELTSKLNEYNVIEYGNVIRYLPAYAAAGQYIEFCLVDVHTRTIAEGSRQRFDLTDPYLRLQAVVVSLNYFRLLRTMAPHVSELTRATPLFKKTDGVTFLKDHVRKDCRNRKLTAPRALYRLLQAGEVPFAVTVELSPSGEALIIKPVGVRIPSGGGGLSYDEMKEAIRCVLRCLEYLHSKGFVHRDIRWSNIIRHYSFNADGSISNCTFLVIDFEFAANDGNAIRIHDYIFGKVVPFGASYKAYHDLYFVGLLVRTWLTTFPSVERGLHDAAMGFVNYVQNTDATKPSASDGLQHSWLRL